MRSSNTYLIFDGECRQALKFYRECLGAELQQMTYGEIPGEKQKGSPDRILHARLQARGLTLMASDAPSGTPVKQGNNFAIAVHCDSSEEVDRLFKGLSAGGTVKMAPQETFWAVRYADFTDRFGVNWSLELARPGFAV